MVKSGKHFDLPYRPTSPGKALQPLGEREDTEIPPAPWNQHSEKGTSNTDEPRKFDSTGMFHWCPVRSLEEAVIVSTGRL